MKDLTLSYSGTTLTEKEDQSIKEKLMIIFIDALIN